MSYLKIAALFKSEGLLTHSGKEFKATHVFSIYKKGKVREERLNRPDIMEVGQVSIYQINQLDSKALKRHYDKY